MRSLVSCFAAAFIGLAGVGVSFADNSTNATNMPAGGGQGVRNMDDGPGTTRPSMVSEKMQRSVQHGLATLTDKLLNKDGLGDLNKWVIYEDTPMSAMPKPNDMSANSDKKFQSSDDLNAAVDQLRDDWNEKYKDSFTLSGSDRRAAVFNNSFQIYSGDIGNLARTAGEQILPGNQQPMDQPQAATPEVRDVTVCINCDNSSTTPQTSKNAILHLRWESGLIGGNWKLVLPTSTQPQAIHDALLSQLRQLHNDQASWPVDENTACRVVTQRILSTLSTPATSTDMPAPMPDNPMR